MEPVQIKSLEERFITFETSIGINEDNFAKKYIFQNLRQNILESSKTISNEQLCEMLDTTHKNLFLEFGSQVQSDIDGFSQQEQNLLHYYGGTLISDACQFLQLPISTCISAQTIFHRFFIRCSFLKHDLRDVAMGSIFLAGKAQETIKKPRDISYVFDQMFKIEEGADRPVTILEDQGMKFQKMKETVQTMERVILKELGFELFQITWNEQPHRLMYFYLNLFKPAKQGNQSISFQNLTRSAYNYLNDSYKTTLCVYLPFQMQIASCLYLAFRKEKVEMPPVAWWTIMETSLKNLQIGAGKIQQIYNQIKTPLKFSDCLAVINSQTYMHQGSLQLTLKYHDIPDKLRSGNTMTQVAEAIAKAKMNQSKNENKREETGRMRDQTNEKKISSERNKRSRSRSNRRRQNNHRRSSSSSSNSSQSSSQQRNYKNKNDRQLSRHIKNHKHHQEHSNRYRHEHKQRKRSQSSSQETVQKPPRFFEERSNGPVINPERSLMIEKNDKPSSTSTIEDSIERITSFSSKNQNAKVKEINFKEEHSFSKKYYEKNNGESKQFDSHKRKRSRSRSEHKRHRRSRERQRSRDTKRNREERRYSRSKSREDKSSRSTLRKRSTSPNKNPQSKTTSSSQSYQSQPLINQNTSNSFLPQKISDFGSQRENSSKFASNLSNNCQLRVLDLNNLKSLSQNQSNKETRDNEMKQINSLPETVNSSQTQQQASFILSSNGKPELNLLKLKITERFKNLQSTLQKMGAPLPL